MLDHITTTTTVCLKSKRQNVSISYMKLKEMHSLPLTLVLVHVLMDSSSLCHAFTYTNMIFFPPFPASISFTGKVFSNHNSVCKNFEFHYEKCLYDCGI